MAWSQEAQDLLAQSVYAADRKGVARALDQLGIPETLNYSEGIRFLSLIGFPDSKQRPVFRVASKGSEYANVDDLIAQLLAVQADSTERGKAARERKRLLSTPEAERELSYVREHERAMVEVARANEKLAKSGVVPTWSARSHRKTANNAKAARIKAEDAFLNKRGFKGIDQEGTMAKIKSPTVTEIVKELKEIKNEAMAAGKDSAIYDEEGLDIRLQVLKNGQSTVHWGDSGYDTDHHGYWGAGSMVEDTDLTDLAKDLISEVEDSAAQDDGEDYLGHDVPHGGDKLVVENITGQSEERGWRLFWWSGREGDTIAVTESGYATSDPFRTRREAVAYALKKYGIKPINPPW